MKGIEKKLLKVTKVIAKERIISSELPARCYSFFHQPKRPTKH